MTYVDVRQEGKTLHIRTRAQRLDGDNYIFNTLKEGDYFSADIDLVELDLYTVEFINSLGVTELVNLHRKFVGEKSSPAVIKFINVDKKVNAILELVDFHKVVEIAVKK